MTAATGRVAALRLVLGDQLSFDLAALADLDPQHDRAMLCGSPAMLADTSGLLDRLGFQVSPRIGDTGDYVIERAFVEK